MSLEQAKNFWTRAKSDRIVDAELRAATIGEPAAVLEGVRGVARRLGYLHQTRRHSHRHDGGPPQRLRAALGG
jgi:hypothetical protein